MEERIEWNSDDPKLDAAATKIQANYKGYRTRKEIKTAHSKQTAMQYWFISVKQEKSWLCKVQVK